MIFFLKSHNVEKTERDLLRLFNIHSVAEHQKVEERTLWGIFFSKKSLTMPKLKGGPFGEFFFRKKSHNAK